MVKKLKVFISYIAQDQAFKQDLLKQLAILQRQGTITTEDSCQSDADADSQRAIQVAIEECQIALLLLSEEYLASDFIRSVVLPRLLERTVQHDIRILPIIVRPCQWENVNEIKTFNVTPPNGMPLNSFPEATEERAQAWMNVADQINQLVKELLVLQFHSMQHIDLHCLPRPTTPFIGRIQTLTELDNAFVDKTISVVNIIAAMGVGKSALINEWLKRMAPSYNGAHWVFGWSFYNQCYHHNLTASTELFEQALPFFGHKDSLPLTDEARARCLVALLQEKSYILVLEGVEALQTHPNSVTGSNEITDIGLKTLLSDLQTPYLWKQRLLVITSQSPLTALENYKTYKSIELENLTPGDGANLLQSLGVQGSPWQLAGVSQTCGGHALTLGLLGNLLIDQHAGQVSYYKKLPAVIEVSDQNHYTLRVLRYYDESSWATDSPERSLFYLLSLFDRPMRLTEKQVLLKQISFAQPLTTLSELDWKRMFSHLRKLGLLFDGRPNEWDTHPLIRRYFRKQLRESNPTGWQQAHQVLFDYFQTLSRPNPTTLNLDSLYRAVHHGILAEAYQDALEVYRTQILSYHKESTAQVGRSFAQELAIIADFFRSDWKQPVSPTLSQADQAWLLAQAAICLKSMGRLSEATAAQQANIQIFEQQHAWENAAESAEILVDLLLLQGLLSEAKHVAQQAIEWAQQTDNSLRQIINHTKHATVLHRLGELVDNVSGFQFAEVLQSHYQPTFPQLYARAGTQYCALLLDRAKDVTERETILTRAQYALQVSKQHLGLPEIAFDHLMVGRVLAALHRPTESQAELNAAVEDMRQTGNRYDLPEVLMARAIFYREQGHIDKAQPDLNEVLDISTRYGMQLYEAEACLLQGHLLLDKQHQQMQFLSLANTQRHSVNLSQAHALLKDAEHAYQRAAKLIEDMDYGLRMAELSLLAARLAHYAHRSHDALTHLKTAKHRIQTIKQWGLLPQWERVSSEIC